jgi:hypothetical protein
LVSKRRFTSGSFLAKADRFLPGWEPICIRGLLGLGRSFQ